MPYDRVTAFGTSRGNLTDNERMTAQQGQSQAAIDAQMRALQAEINDRQAGRAFQGQEANADRSFQGGMFDKNAGLQKDLDASQTARALGVVGAQMGPANSDAAIRKAEFDANAPRRALQAEVFKQFMPQLTGGGAPDGAVSQMPPGGTGPAAPRFQVDPDMAMVMAMGGDVGGYLTNKRQSANADRAHDDSEDATTMGIINGLASSGRPDGIALAQQLASRLHNKSLNGIDVKALRPTATPDEIVGKSPAAMQKLDNAATLLANASKVGGEAAGLDQAKPILDDFVKSLTDQGAKPEEAQAFVSNYLKKRLPANAGKISQSILNFLTAGINQEVAGPANERTAAARKLAGLVD